MWQPSEVVLLQRSTFGEKVTVCRLDAWSYISFLQGLGRLLMFVETGESWSFVYSVGSIVGSILRHSYKHSASLERDSKMLRSVL